MKEQIKIINLKYLDEISTNVDFRKKIFSLFRTSVSEFKISMPKALEEHDYEELGELIHKAKSSIKILGMDTQAEVISVIEKKIKENIVINNLQGIITEFLNDCEIAVSEIFTVEENL
jgi:SepF-like predicted cell division protein (DUF552 family)